VDSGNEWRTAISEEFAKALGYPRAKLRAISEKAVGTAKNGATIRILGEVPEPLRFHFEQGPSLGTFLMRPAVLESLSSPVNISGPFLHHHRIDQLHSRGALQVRGGLVPVHAAKQAPTCWVYAKGNARAAPRAITWIQGVASVHGIAVVGLLRGNQQLGQRWGQLVPAGEGRADVGPDGTLEVAVYNPTTTAIALHGSSRIASIELRDCPEVRRALAEGPAGPAPKRDQGQGAEARATPEWVRRELRPRLQESDSALTSAAEVEEALGLLEQYADIFSIDGSYGQTNLLKHAIHTADVVPIKCRNRPINPALIDDLRAQMELWLRHDVIEESASPWASALVAAPKKNGKTRWCVDYRALNKATVKDAYPMPLIEDRLAQLAHARIFSSVDGSGAFHVVELEEDAKPKTAFATPWGLYQFKRMPFGLTNAPATYSRLMQIALAGVPTTMALSYLDDTLVHSRDFPRHLAALRMVLEAHRRAGLKLQPEKCQLFKKRLEYLGHIVTHEGIQPMDAYLEAVKKWPVPATLSETRAFLGKVGYYRRFIQGYARLAAPLTDAIKEENLPDPKGKAIRITKELRESHRALVRALCAAPILAFPRFDQDASFIVDTDWSQEHRAIGAVLSQEQEGLERVIAYGAKKLSRSQANYPATKGELFAVIYFLNHWRYYLKWKRFVLRTDHRALQWIRTMEAPSGMVARWLLTLADYDFEVQYRKGEQHGNADALSRAPHVEELGVLSDDAEDGLAALTRVPLARLQALAASDPGDDGEEEDDEDDEAEPVEWYDRGPGRLPRTAEEWRREQGQDVDLRLLRGWLQGGGAPDKAERRGMHPRLRCLADRAGQLHLGADGVLYAEPLEGKSRPVVPFHVEVAYLRHCHELVGHRGLEATATVAAQNAYVLAGKAAAQHVLASCVPCQVKAGAPKPQRHTYATVPNSYPFQRLSIDFVGPLPRTKRGNVMALTIKDPFSKWVEAFPLRRATAEAVARHLEQDIFPRFGFPEEIHSDRGTQFTGELMDQLGLLLGVKTTVTPAYHPQSNPVERAHRDLKAGLRAALEQAGGQEWDVALPQILLAFRISPARGTAMSPFRVLFGRDPHLPIGVIEAAPARTDLIPYVEELESRMKRVQEWAAENLAREVRRQQAAYRQGGWAPKVGDQVWLYSPATTASTGRKLARPWTGPWRVEREISQVLFRVVDARGRGADAALDRLKPFYEPRDGQSATRPPTDHTSPSSRDLVSTAVDNDTSVVLRRQHSPTPTPTHHVSSDDNSDSDGGTDSGDPSGGSPAGAAPSPGGAAQPACHDRPAIAEPASPGSGGVAPGEGHEVAAEGAHGYRLRRARGRPGAVVGHGQPGRGRGGRAPTGTEVPGAGQGGQPDRPVSGRSPATGPGTSAAGRAGPRAEPGEAAAEARGEPGCAGAGSAPAEAEQLARPEPGRGGRGRAGRAGPKGTRGQLQRASESPEGDREREPPAGRDHDDGLCDAEGSGGASGGPAARPRATRKAAAQANRLLEKWSRRMDRRRRLELIPEEVYSEQ
jgi:hypothetical protein